MKSPHHKSWSEWVRAVSACLRPCGFSMEKNEAGAVIFTSTRGKTTKIVQLEPTVRGAHILRGRKGNTKFLNIYGVPEGGYTHAIVEFATW